MSAEPFERGRARGIQLAEDMTSQGPGTAQEAAGAIAAMYLAICMDSEREPPEDREQFRDGGIIGASTHLGDVFFLLSLNNMAAPGLH